MDNTIRIMLGAYIDSVNAQDINCFNIAKHIDKSKFEVHTLVHDSSFAMPGVICHTISKNRILKNIQKYYTLKIVDADLYYLPRVEKVDMWFAKNTKHKTVSSVEIQTVFDDEKYNIFFNKYISDYFCISRFLAMLNEKKWNKKKKVLYLGVDSETELIRHKTIRHIIWIGSVVERKRPELFLQLAKRFPNLNFTMVGDGILLDKMKLQTEVESITNINFTGRINNIKVMEALRSADLLCVTSEKEGLPKVVLEAASKNVPSIYINEYYQIDYLEDGINGYGVHNIWAMGDVIVMLLNDNKLYQSISNNSGLCSRRYQWRNLIKDYEDFFMKACGSKNA